MTLLDNHNRPLNYLRLAVTDRCNLRCFYCMPNENIQYLPKKEILSFEEMERLVRLLASLGVTKIRLTGGEPFVRTDLMKFIRRIVEIPGIRDIHLTTNGILTGPHIPELKRLGISSVNLSLDTLDSARFFEITKRNEFDRTIATFEKLLEYEIPVKVNAVVMEGKNIEDIIPLAELAKTKKVDVRFIEEMPFNGRNDHRRLTWNHLRIIDHIRSHYPAITKRKDEPHSTSYAYSIPGFTGSIGVIAAYSRTFCGTCNRIRITAQGELKTCLYDAGALNLKERMRSGFSDEMLKHELMKAFGNRALNGFEAEQRKTTDTFASMSTIGG